MRILIIGTICGRKPKPKFKASMPSTDWIFSQGFRKLGYNVKEYCVLDHFKRRGVDRGVQKVLAEYKPDCILMGNVLDYTRKDVARIIRTRKRKDAVFAIWHGDQRVEVQQEILDTIKECDVLFHTTSGSRLKRYKKLTGINKAAFLFNPIYPLDDVKGRNTGDILFTGVRRDNEKYNGDGVREAVVENLLNNPIKGVTFRHFGGETKVRGDDYVAAIKGAKIGLGISTYHEFYKYSSDRITGYLGNGCFYLAKHFHGIDDLLEDGKHLVTFNSIEECREKIKYYIRNDAERKKIALEGKKYSVENWGYVKMAKYMLDVMLRGKSSEWWADIY